MSLADFTQQFFETALWSSTGDDEQPLDKKYKVTDFDPTCKKRLEEECAKFWEQVSDEVKLRWEDSTAGHDFWLTRCGHGSNFLDGDYPPGVAQRLYDTASQFGSVDLYVGDDGKVYAS